MIEPEIEFSKLLLQEAGEGEWSLRITLFEHIAYYEGHFPDRAIFPAVGLLDLCIYSLQKAIPHQKICLKSVNRSKFIQPIFGNQSLKGRLQIKSHEELQRANFHWTCEEGRESFAKLDMLFELQEL